MTYSSSLKITIPAVLYVNREGSPQTPRSIILLYLTRIRYRRPLYPPRVALEADLRSIISSWKIHGLGEIAEKMIPPSAAMGEMSYQEHEYTVKLLISIFTFFMIYIDDRSSRGDPAPFANFQRNYALATPQLDPVLDQFADFLTVVWSFYDPFTANAIVSSSLEFINGCYLERLTEKMPINPEAEKFPYFLRSKTGVAQAYAMMIFPAALHPSPTAFIQAIPSISYWIDITNDILSFYKEELAHETNNYIHLRAAVARRRPVQVLRDLVDESLHASNSVESILKRNTVALNAWLTFKTGYITFHISQDRYKLSELMLGHKSPAESNNELRRLLSMTIETTTQ
ncbi:hypothetical protein FRC19_001301 [Serendipita sp. 401]|nr:hypothetical protein FRC19_001301 [Serendipita sp. 401]